MSGVLDLRGGSLLQCSVDTDAAQAELPYAIRALQNAGRIARAGSVHSLFGRYLGAPIVVACDGPSLERNLEDLRPWRERVVLIAVDAAAKTLLSSELLPDFVVALDSRTRDTQDLARLAASGVTALVAEGAIAPTAFTGFNHRVYIFRTTDHAPWPWLNRLGFERALLRGAGSATTCAFELAHRMGAEPVVLIGADAPSANRDIEWLIKESNRPNMPRMINATGAGMLGGGCIRRELLSSLGIQQWIDADLVRPMTIPARLPRNHRRPRTGDRFDFHLLDLVITPNDWLVFEGTLEDVACRAVSRCIPPLSRVLNLGAGDEALESRLPSGCTYTRGEVRVEPSTALGGDVSTFGLPEGKFDVIAALGLLERIEDVPALLASTFERAPLLVTSLTVGGSCRPGTASRFTRQTVPSLDALVSMAQKIGWDLRVAERLDIDSHRETWVLALARR
jgi:hypothetical protein